MRWQDHDARWLADALGAEKPAGVPAHVNLTSVGALARTIPCRISKHGFKHFSWPSAGSSSTWQPSKEPPFPLWSTQNKMDLLKHLVGENVDPVDGTSGWLAEFANLSFHVCSAS